MTKKEYLKVNFFMFCRENPTGNASLKSGSAFIRYVPAQWYSERDNDKAYWRVGNDTQTPGYTVHTENYEDFSKAWKDFASRVDFRKKVHKNY